MAYKQIIDRIPDDAFDWADEPITILVDVDDNRWFLVVDVARVLGYSRYEEAIKRHVNPNYIERFGQIKDIIVSRVSARVRDDFRFLSEEGLYHFINDSKRKPYARQLKADYF